MPFSDYGMISKIAQGPTNYNFLETQQAESNALRNLGARREAGTYGEDRNWIRKLREQQMKQWQRDDYKFQEEVENEGFTNLKKRQDYFKMVLPQLDPQSYSKARDWIISKDRTDQMRSVLPPPESFKSPQEFEVWKKKVLTTPTMEHQQEILQQKLESAEKVSAGKISSIEKVAEERNKSAKELADERARAAEKLEEIKAGHRKELETEKQKTKQQNAELKTSKYNAAKKLLDESYANLMGTDVSDVQKRMNPDQSAAYRRILIIAERNLSTMEPAQAIDEAIKEYWKGKGKAKTQTNKPLDEVTAKEILKEAGGDKEKARKIAKERGYTF